jgi:DNA repair ATPase RecN
MIKSLNIKNFQSHKDTNVSFTDGINVITGSSDCGKSAILRALYLAIENRPSGESYRTLENGVFTKKDTEVSMTVDDNEVTRVKGNTNNSYKVNDVELNAFGTSVPDEVSKALNIQDINIQKQFDKAFLLDDTPGKIAEHLNKMANLEIIDITLKNLKTEQDNLRRQEKNKQDNTKILCDKLVQLEYIDKLEIEINNLYNKAKELQDETDKNIRLERLLRQLREVEELRKSLPDYTAEEELVKDIENRHNKLKEDKNKNNRLNNLLNQYKRLEDDTVKYDCIKYEEEVLLLLDRCNKLKKDKEVLSKSEDLLDKLDKIEFLIDFKIDEIKALEEKYNEMVPDICPLCGGKMK